MVRKLSGFVGAGTTWPRSLIFWAYFGSRKMHSRAQNEEPLEAQFQAFEQSRLPMYRFITLSSNFHRAVLSSSLQISITTSADVSLHAMRLLIKNSYFSYFPKGELRNIFLAWQALPTAPLRDLDISRSEIPWGEEQGEWELDWDSKASSEPRYHMANYHAEVIG